MSRKKVPKVITWLLAIALIVGLMPVMPFLDGEAKAENVIEVTTLGQLTDTPLTTGTYKLMNGIDFAENGGKQITVASGANVVLNLNGKTIKYYDNDNSSNATTDRMILNQGTLTITGDGQIQGIGETCVGILYNSGSATIENGTFTTEGNLKWALLENSSTGVMCVNGGEFKATNTTNTGSYLIANPNKLVINDGSFECKAAIRYGIQNRDTGDAYMEINGGSFSGVHGAVAINCGTYKITGGNFKATNFYATYIAGEVAEVRGTISGGTFESQCAKGKYSIYVGNDTQGDGGICKDAYATITGGVIKAPTGKKTVYKATNTGNVTIKGGTYLLTAPPTQTADQSIETWIADGYYQVTEASAANVGLVKEKETQNYMNLSYKGTITTDTGTFTLKISEANTDYSGTTSCEVNGTSIEKGSMTDNTVTLTAKKPGKSTITVTRPADKKYKAASNSITIDVLDANSGNVPKIAEVVAPDVVPPADKNSSATLSKTAADQIKDAIDSAQNGEKVIVQLPENNVGISKDIFEKAMANKGATLVIETKSNKADEIAATFTFEGDAIANLAKVKFPLDTGVTATPANQQSSAISTALPSDATALAITLAHDGPFPGPVKITIPVDMAPGTTVYVYYVNDSGKTDKLELLKGGKVVVSPDKTITFTLEHASDYVISSKAAKPSQEDGDKPDQQKDNKAKEKGSPSTGDDFNPVIYLGIMLLAVVVIGFLVTNARRKHLKK